LRPTSILWLSALKITDASLVGFSMGTGEITRYIGKYGPKRVRNAVLIGTLAISREDG